MRRFALLLAVIAVAAACAPTAPDPAADDPTSPTGSTSAPPTTAPAPVPATPAACPAPEPALLRLAGPDRFATAVAVSRTLWPSAGEVVVASGRDFPDALAAGALSVAAGAPLLLTELARLPDAVADEIERLGATSATVVGGTAAVGDEVVDALEKAGLDVRRTAGTDRYATAAAVAGRTGAGADVALASGQGFADAVAAGGLARPDDVVPTLLTRQASLPEATRSALEELEPDRVLVVGGPAAVADDVVAEVEALGLDVERLAGPSRYATSAAVVAHVAPARLLFATGAGFPDALGATAAAGRLGAATLLVPRHDLVDTPQAEEAGSAWSSPCGAVVGGPQAVGVRVTEQLAALSDAPPPDGDPVLVAAGDIASCGLTADSRTAELAGTLAGTVVTLGDNAYERGRPEEFRDCYDPTWGRHRLRTRASPGNHDYGTGDAEAYFAYFGARAGPVGKGWYGFDLGPDWHVVVLNSNCGFVGCSAGSEQELWLREELAANADEHVVAAWHHARFSSGAHGSDPSTADLVRALHEGGADLLLVGHDHHYERLAPVDESGGPTPTGGIRHFVVGTGGASLRSLGAPLAATEHRENVHGVLELTLRPDGYAWRFLDTAGQVRDAGDARL